MMTVKGYCRTIMKRATAQAQVIDPDLEIHRGIHGHYYASNRTFVSQQSTPERPSVAAVIFDLQIGVRPLPLH